MAETVRNDLGNRRITQHVCAVQIVEAVIPAFGDEMLELADPFGR